MSCYLIDKKEYMRAAGFIGCLLDNGYIWLWNAEEGRRKNAEDMKKTFTKLYYNNALAVSIRYNEEEPTDPNTYDEEFTATYKQTKNFEMFYPNKMQDAVEQFISFTESIIYQSCDDERCEEVAESTLSPIITGITKYLVYKLMHYDRSIHFDLSEINARY